MNASTSEKIWRELITPYFEKCYVAYGGLICPKSGYDVFCSHYQYLTDFAKSHYMAKSVVRLNRHKVSAAIMIAILKAKPIKKVDALFYDSPMGQPKIWPFNEALAITVGLSVLRAFIMQRVDEAFVGKPVSKKKFEGVCKQDRVIFEDGIPLAPKARAEWEWELYQVRLEGAYNLLAMAHILSDLENIARLKYFNEHSGEKMIVPEYMENDDEQIEDAALDDVVDRL